MRTTVRCFVFCMCSGLVSTTRKQSFLDFALFNEHSTRNRIHNKLRNSRGIVGGFLCTLQLSLAIRGINGTTARKSRTLRTGVSRLVLLYEIRHKSFPPNKLKGDTYVYENHHSRRRARFAVSRWEICEAAAARDESIIAFLKWLWRLCLCRSVLR